MCAFCLALHNLRAVLYIEKEDGSTSFELDRDRESTLGVLPFLSFAAADPKLFLWPAVDFLRQPISQLSSSHFLAKAQIRGEFVHNNSRRTPRTECETRRRQAPHTGENTPHPAMEELSQALESASSQCVPHPLPLQTKMLAPFISWLFSVV